MRTVPGGQHLHPQIVGREGHEYKHLAHAGVLIRKTYLAENRARE